MKMSKNLFNVEIESIKYDLLDTVEILDTDEENFSFRIGLKGPKGTKYEGNTYEINFIGLKDFPFKPPKIVCKTPEFPFSDVNGEVSIDFILDKEYKKYRFKMKLKDIISGIIDFMKLLDSYTNNKNKKVVEKKPIIPPIEKASGNSFSKINPNSGNVDNLNKVNLLQNIKSKLILRKLFSRLDEKLN